MSDYIYWSIFILCIIGLYIFLIVWLCTKKKNKWNCVEQGCELSFEGEYTSKNQCENSCKNKKRKNEKQVSFEKDHTIV
jgi:hypothetical protein